MARPRNAAPARPASHPTSRSHTLVTESFFAPGVATSSCGLDAVTEPTVFGVAERAATQPASARSRAARTPRRPTSRRPHSTYGYCEASRLEPLNPSKPPYPGTAEASREAPVALCTA